MKRIYKYPLHRSGDPTMMPSGAKILTVGVDPAGALSLWAEVDPNATMHPRKIVVVGTGHNLPKGDCRYIGSISESVFVWHVYDCGELKALTPEPSIHDVAQLLRDLKRPDLSATERQVVSDKLDDLLAHFA